MLIKHAIITILVCWALIVGGAFGITLYRHEVSLKTLLEYSWGLSAAITIVGFLARGGAATGTDILRSEGALHTSQNPEGYLQAESDDLRAGFSFGTIVMFSGLVVFAGALVTLTAFFRQ